VAWIRSNDTCPICRTYVDAVEMGEEAVDIEQFQEEEEESLDWEEWLEREWLLEEEQQDLDEERHSSVFRVTGEGIQIYQGGEWGPLR
jgi:hypothetical protein